MSGRRRHPTQVPRRGDVPADLCERGGEEGDDYTDEGLDGDGRAAAVLVAVKAHHDKPPHEVAFRLKACDKGRTHI